jgi:predicted XRE-type DNA-binding protein
LTASEVLAAFLHLPEGEQETIRKKVQVATAPEVTEEQKRRAEAAIVAALRLGIGRGGPTPPLPARPLSKEERLSPAHLAVRERTDQEERLFAENLARLLAEKQLTQAELARLLGVGQSAVSMMLSRKCRPQPRTLGKLAAALGVSVEQLWPGKLAL